MDPIKLLEISNPKELKKVLNEIIQTYASVHALNNKLDKVQPVEMAGKFLAIDNDGAIIPRVLTEQAGLFGMSIIDGVLCIEQQNIDTAKFGLTEEGVLYVDIIE